MYNTGLLEMTCTLLETLTELPFITPTDDHPNYNYDGPQSPAILHNKKQSDKNKALIDEYCIKCSLRYV